MWKCWLTFEWRFLETLWVFFENGFWKKPFPSRDTVTVIVTTTDTAAPYLRISSFTWKCSSFNLAHWHSESATSSYIEFLQLLHWKICITYNCRLYINPQVRLKRRWYLLLREDAAYNSRENIAIFTACVSVIYSLFTV